MTNQNEIEVKDFTIVSPSSEIERAKKLLRDNGYFVDNLWRTEDVTGNYECSEEEAQALLSKALTSEATMDCTWFAINHEADINNLKKL